MSKHDKFVDRVAAYLHGLHSYVDLVDHEETPEMSAIRNEFMRRGSGCLPTFPNWKRRLSMWIRKCTLVPKCVAAGPAIFAH